MTGRQEEGEGLARLFGVVLVPGVCVCCGREASGLVLDSIPGCMACLANECDDCHPDDDDG